MLTIKNIHKIQNTQLVIGGHGYGFEITEIIEVSDKYGIAITPRGNKWIPITLTINREAELFGNNGEVKKYVIRRDGLDPQYIGDENLVTPYEFIKHITYYLNNPNQ